MQVAEAALGASIQNITFHRVRDVAPNKVSPSVHDFQFVLLFIFSTSVRGWIMTVLIGLPRAGNVLLELQAARIVLSNKRL